ncbi:FAD-binding oxidoreductase [Amycolatopsis sp. BJA-103]|uniref:FAD-binding oxidoreductase n=1 Tax=Amycolatopsis sp. BJA-103 TaxID=1911175 RepID=UPI000C75D420|nr:FAD-linked oxidase C-terminal domain-containing protein [Amycolatopsis sp. BJA-103]AUI61790.1 FAD-binding oxidoreductase [Amycolatopsis sp. BJA-103]PNE20912.1 FAD-binding oxidoreductase [Amycolatopsis sp. BJA-103]
MGLPIDDLLAVLPAGRVLTDPDVLAAHCRDEADLCDAGTPLAVVRPRSTAEVAATVRVAAAHRLPVVPQGARTGLTGGANAVDGALVVSLTGLNRIIEIDPDEQIAVVQPGVVNAELCRAAAKEGLAYLPDPGSFESSTIGGNVSTDAGGMCCVKYGVTGEYVLGLEVVLADGEILRCGRRTVKGVAGYDLTGLFVGSEGTLGIITEITVRLRPAPEAARTMVAVYPTVAAAGRAVSSVIAAGHVPSMLELLDRTHLRAIEAYRPQGLDTEAAAMLLIATDTHAATDLAAIADCCRSAGASELYVAEDALEAQALTSARRLAHPAMEHLAVQAFPSGRGGLVVDDVAVPRTRVADLVAGVEEISARHGVLVGVVGHAGDGNLHPVIVVDRADQSSMDSGRLVFDEIMRLGLSLGGTCTGEHGVGLLKRDWLAREIGPVGMRIHRAVKLAFDPDGIFNPGKVIALR